MKERYLISLTNRMASAASLPAPTDEMGAEKTGTEMERSAVENVVSPNGNAGGAVPIIEEYQNQE